MGIATRPVNFFVESFRKMPAIVETRERIGDCVAVQTLQVVVFEDDRDAEHSFRSENIDKSGLKRNGRLTKGGEMSSAEQHFIPQSDCLIFRDIYVGQGQKEPLKKRSTRTRFDAFECVNDEVHVGVIWTHARGVRNAGAR